MSSGPIESRRIQVSDDAINEAGRILRQVWPQETKFSNEYLTWLYRDNPVGTAVGFNAYDGAELVAHYATVPMEAVYEGTRVRGLLSLNTATHSSHQGKGLFTKLANQTYEIAAQEGFSFVVGVANANSTPGFVRKLGFQLVTPLDVRVGFGDLPAETNGPVTWGRHWNAATLQWRLRAPSAKYFVREEGATAIVQSATAYPLIHAPLAVLREPELIAVARTLPRTRRSLRVWLGCGGKMRWPLRYRPLPDRLKPSPLNLILKNLGRKTRAVDATSVRFQAIDFDAY